MPVVETHLLVEQAEKAMEACQPALGVKFVERALESDASNPKLYELLAQCHLEAIEDDPLPKARNALAKAIELQPESGFEKFLLMGQLSVASEAIGYYETGTRLLMDRIAAINGSTVDEDEKKLLMFKLGSALCSMAEIYLTDCCDEPEAETKCEEYLKTALEYSKTNPELYQTLASVRLSQCRPDEARVLLEQSMELWYIDPTATLDENGDEQLIQVDPNWPIYSLRIALSKLLMEVGAHERALAVLQTCQVENEDDAEMWYLFGWCYYLLHGEQVGSHEYHNEFMQDAKECFDAVLKVNSQVFVILLDPNQKTPGLCIFV